MGPSRLPAAFLACAAVAGCGGAHPRAPSPGPPISAGPAPRYRPPPRGAAANAGHPIGRLRCRIRLRPGHLAHLEVFAHRRVVVIPAGIGVVPPLAVETGRIRGGRCAYALRTREPTGLVEVEPGRARTLGDLFAVWGQPLSRSRLAGFAATRNRPVAAFVAGRRWSGDPRAIPLVNHAVIVLEVGGFVPPHRSYRFPSP